MFDGPEKPKKKRKSIIIRVDDDLHAAAKRRADETGFSLSEILRAWIRLFAANEANPPNKRLLEKEKKRPERKPPKK